MSISDELPAFDKPPSYHSFLLRFWEERSLQPALSVWRFSVENPQTNQRHSFADLDALTDWLRAEMTQTTTTIPQEVTPDPNNAPL